MFQPNVVELKSLENLNLTKYFCYNIRLIGSTLRSEEAKAFNRSHPLRRRQ